MNEIFNYIDAMELDMKRLKCGNFDNNLFWEVHNKLLSGNVRKVTDTIGQYRENQNFIGKNIGKLIYTPPKPEEFLH